jgi:hypothetical protein
MALKVTTLESLPRPTRNKKRSLEGIDEWVQLKAKLAEGLRPYEAVYITFTKQDLERLKIKTVGRVFTLMAKEYIKRLSLPYDVWRYHSEGQEVVVIAARGANVMGAETVVEQRPAPATAAERRTQALQHRAKHKSGSKRSA